MSRAYMELGSTPCDEECAQVGADGYADRARMECRVYARQLQRQFPALNFGVKSFQHDFGTYYETVVYFDDEDEQSYESVATVERTLPERWDAEARKELGL